MSEINLKMRLCSIVNVWFDAIDLLPYCLQNQADCGVDGIIIIWSEASNYGEVKMDYLWPAIHPISEASLIPIHIFQREPQFRDPRNSETDKRNFGLEGARQLGYTHFLTLDQDEFYKPGPFLKAKERFLNEPDLQGLVCECQTYFKYPWLTIGKDRTLVPFIQKLTSSVKHEFNKKFPFAWDGGGIRIDPTRSTNVTYGIEMCDVTMHHASWIRSDYQLKIRSSTARYNLEKSCILNDLMNAKEGYFCEYYKKILTKSEILTSLIQHPKHSSITDSLGS